jgi:hypothetical protein
MAWRKKALARLRNSEFIKQNSGAGTLSGDTNV